MTDQEYRFEACKMVLEFTFPQPQEDARLETILRTWRKRHPELEHNVRLRNQCFWIVCNMFEGCALMLKNVFEMSAGPKISLGSLAVFYERISAQLKLDDDALPGTLILT